MTLEINVPTSLINENDLRTSHLWSSYHIFYGGNTWRLLDDCVIPLTERLEKRSYVVDWFFINYWAQGAHVRLRLRVRSEDVQIVNQSVLHVVNEYLIEHPSYHPMKGLSNLDFYDSLFRGEYAEQDRDKFFRTDGSIIFEPNNSIIIREYEPEWLRYGGPLGMLIAERFFIESTQLVSYLIHRGNLAVRTLLLGAGTQIMFITAICLFRKFSSTRDFFMQYHRRWKNSYGVSSSYASNTGREEYSPVVQAIREHIIQWGSKLLKNDLTTLPHILSKWATVCNETRQRIQTVCDTSYFLFQSPEGERKVTNVEEAVRMLAPSLIHMTNNRLLVSIGDEAFIAYQLACAMNDDGCRK